MSSDIEKKFGINLGTGMTEITRSEAVAQIETMYNALIAEAKAPEEITTLKLAKACSLAVVEAMAEYRTQPPPSGNLLHVVQHVGAAFSLAAVQAMAPAMDPRLGARVRAGGRSAGLPIGDTDHPLEIISYLLKASFEANLGQQAARMMNGGGVPMAVKGEGAPDGA